MRLTERQRKLSASGDLKAAVPERAMPFELVVAGRHRLVQGPSASSRLLCAVLSLVCIYGSSPGPRLLIGHQVSLASRDAFGTFWDPPRSSSWPELLLACPCGSAMLLLRTIAFDTHCPPLQQLFWIRETGGNGGGCAVKRGFGWGLG